MRMEQSHTKQEVQPHQIITILDCTRHLCSDTSREAREEDTSPALQVIAACYLLAFSALISYPYKGTNG